MNKHSMKNPMDLTQYIRTINHFPKRGVAFKDITPLLLDPKASRYCLDALHEKVGRLAIDKVVAIESRGFFFGSMLAARLGAGFVPIRKPGKLPYAIEREFYILEYGEDAVEIHKDAIQAGDKVLLHDDVLATGGTAKAACNLILRLGGKVVQCNFIMELTGLEGRKKLEGFSIESILKYD
jgi:adenine phosphoribosyltransferase